MFDEKDLKVDLTKSLDPLDVMIIANNLDRIEQQRKLNETPLFPLSKTNESDSVEDGLIGLGILGLVVFILLII